MSLRSVKVLLAGVLMLSAVGSVQAGAITWATNPAPNDYGWDGETVGTQFKTTNSVTVCALGIWDHLEDGLANSYSVSLWDLNENLLATANVAAGTAARLEDGSRWTDIAGVTLAANTTYVIAAYRPNFNDLFPWIFANEVTLSTGIAENDRYEGGVTFPHYDEYRDAVIGANFQYTPEPSSIVLLCLGGAGAGVMQVRRRRAVNS